MLGVPVTLARGTGDEELDPVWVTAHEMGFETRLHPRVRARVDLFYNVLEDFQTSGLKGGFPVPIVYSNGGRTVAGGGEFVLEFRLFDSMSGFTTYSVLSAHGPSEAVSPRHKASAGLRGKLGSRLRYALSGSIVGHTRIEE